MAVPHYQFTSRNLSQLEFALRYRLLGARSASPEVRQEAAASALILLLPFAHLGGRIRRRVDEQFAVLERRQREVAGERARMWLPLLRALYEMVSARPDRALVWFAEIDDYRISKAGYIALQRRNALFLAAEYDAFARELSSSAARGEMLTALDRLRLGYVERLNGDAAAARRHLSEVEHLDPSDVPWTHRSLFIYLLVEIKLGDGDSAGALALARAMLPRIRRAALAPATGAFECVDAMVRACLAEARRLTGAGEHLEAQARVKEAARAVAHAPALEPPLFAARAMHDRALVALAEGKQARGLALLHQAEERSRAHQVPRFRLRLLEDLLALAAPDALRRADWLAEADRLAVRLRVAPSHSWAPWLCPLATT
jgi:hypothetical protein